MITAIATPSTAEPMRVTPWLLADAQEATANLGGAMSSARTDATPAAHRVSRLALVARAAVVDEVLSALRGAVDDDLVELLLLGWKQRQSLVESARETLGDPVSQRSVALTEHRVATTHQADLHVVVDGTRVLTLSANCELVFHVVEAVALVRNGMLVGLRWGKSEVRGIITVEGQPVARRRLPLHLSVAVELHPGIRLVSAIEQAGHCGTEAKQPGHDRQPVQPQ